LLVAKEFRTAGEAVKIVLGNVDAKSLDPNAIFEFQEDEEW
jgi:hypothetical protein